MIPLLVVALLQATAPVVPPVVALQWDMLRPVEDGPAALARVQGYTYRRYVDGATVGTPIAGVVCYVLPAPWIACAAPLPPLTPGPHTVQITAATSATATESPKSAVFAVTTTDTAAQPANLTIRRP